MVEGASDNHAEFQSYAATLGVSSVDRARMQIRNALAQNSNSPEVVKSIYAALDSVHATLTQQQLDLELPDRVIVQRLADAELRRTLLMDDTLARVRTISTVDKLDEHIMGDPYELAKLALEDAYEGPDTDEELIFKLICGMSRSVRERFQTEEPPIFQKLMTPVWFEFGGLTDDEVDLVKEAFATGRIPVAKALDWALDGLGTEDKMIEQTFAALTAEERSTYRLGYYLSKHSLEPRDDAERARHDAARAAFAELYERLGGGTISEPSDPDLDKALDQLLGGPGVDEMTTYEGRSIAAQIWFDRITDKMRIRADGGSGGA